MFGVCNVPDAANVQRSLCDADFIEEALAQFGGIETLHKGTDEFREAVTRMWNERESLVEKHPDKWVAMGKDGVVSIGDSIEEVLSAVEASGFITSEVAVEFLDANPTTLIL